MKHKRAAALSAIASGVILTAGWGAMVARTTDAARPTTASSTTSDSTAATTAPTPSSGQRARGGADASGSATATVGSFTDGAFTGDAVSTRYGTVQVAVTIEGGVIADVEALQLPSGDGRSQQISNRAEPVLRDAAMLAQSASIQNVSGATYTTRGYAQSLQSALDAAGQR